jgi:hypothetical protein
VRTASRHKGFLISLTAIKCLESGARRVPVPTAARQLSAVHLAAKCAANVRWCHPPELITERLRPAPEASFSRSGSARLLLRDGWGLKCGRVLPFVLRSIETLARGEEGWC